MPVRRRTVRRKVNRKPKANYVHKVARYEARRALRRTLEPKYCDSTQSSLAIDATAGQVVNCLASMARGSGSENNFIGQSIKPIGFYVHGQVVKADSTNMVRLLVVQDVSSGTPTIPNVFDIYGSVRAPLAFLNNNYRATYRLLADRLFRMDTDKASAVFRIKIPAKSLRTVHFHDGTLEQTKGSIFLILLSDSTASTHPTYEGTTRLVYLDA